MYMPEAICYLAAHPPNEHLESYPESQSLLLPSQLPPFIHASLWIIDMEQQLRFAQATDAIAELCQLLMVQAYLSKYKNNQVQGQHSNMHAHTLSAQ
jgi:hypothetical protein